MDMWQVPPENKIKVVSKMVIVEEYKGVKVELRRIPNGYVYFVNIQGEKEYHSSLRDTHIAITKQTNRR